ncbi:MAG: squalene--hopene cyclase [Candidatus Tectomicrobia bacterium]|nr:squalene--hopene cyclase [Candidatus Tectomicrobia bacterium]
MTARTASGSSRSIKVVQTNSQSSTDEKLKRLTSRPSNFFLEKLNRAIQRSQEYLLGEQYEEGYWNGELESNATITAEYIMFSRYMGRIDQAREEKAVTHIFELQLPDGGWGIYYGAPSDINTTTEAYFALKLAGIPEDDPRMEKARKLILSMGGLSKTRVFTKIFLALFGQHNWQDIPSMPVEFILIPRFLYLNIYELSSWSRSVIVPLLIIFAKKLICELPPWASIQELYAESQGERDLSRLRAERFLSWKNFFLVVDTLLKLYERAPIKPLRRLAIETAEQWILERQDEEGSWGGIMPAMMNSLIALKCLGYPNDHPRIVKGISAIERFGIETASTYRLQPCVSPIWDTALAMIALLDSGISPSSAPVTRAARWLISKQTQNVGDWGVKNRKGKPGGWYFEFENEYYPDNDDSAVVLRALKRVALREEKVKGEACYKGLEWVLSMQCRDGGWGSFDVNNNKAIMNEIPFADLRSLLDPSTPDLTGRVLEALGAFEYGKEFKAAKRGVKFLKKHQEPEGSWYGRWGVNYIYGTSIALCGLKAIGEDLKQEYVQKAIRWLEACQNKDGGWGETCKTYDDRSFMGKGKSTASQTGWALMGLLAAGRAESPVVRRGIEYLLDHQNNDGTWNENEFTGTGFPRHFYLKYHMYRNYFPLMALSQYRSVINQVA